MKIGFLDFAGQMHDRIGLTKKDTIQIMTIIGNALKQHIANGDDVQVFRGISIRGHHRKATHMRDINTHELIQIPEHIVPAARFTKNFQQQVRELEKQLNAEE